MTTHPHSPLPSARRRSRISSDRVSHLGQTTLTGAARSAYLSAFHGAILDTLRKHPSRRVREAAGDVAGFGVTRLLSDRFDQKVRAYPDPVRHGRSAAANLFHDWLRREAVQRGEGARRATRVVSSDAVEGFDPVDASVEGSRVAIAKADLERVERVVLRHVGARDWAIYALVHRDGWTTVDVARLYGLRRETISRIIRDVRETLATVLA